MRIFLPHGVAFLLASGTIASGEPYVVSPLTEIEQQERQVWWDNYRASGLNDSLKRLSPEKKKRWADTMRRYDPTKSYEENIAIIQETHMFSSLVALDDEMTIQYLRKQLNRTDYPQVDVYKDILAGNVRGFLIIMEDVIEKKLFFESEDKRKDPWDNPTNYDPWAWAHSLWRSVYYMGEFPYEVRQWARHYGDRIDELTELAGSGVVPYRSTDDALKIVFLKWWEQNKQAIKEGRYSDVKAGKNVEEMETPLSALFLKYGISAPSSNRTNTEAPPNTEIITAASRGENSAASIGGVGQNTKAQIFGVISAGLIVVLGLRRFIGKRKGKREGRGSEGRGAGDKKEMDWQDGGR